MPTLPNIHSLIAVLRAKIDFWGRAGMPMPDTDSLAQKIAEGAAILPHHYTDSFVVPVRTNLDKLLQLKNAGEIKPNSLEQVTGAIYQHAQDAPLRAELRRFLAVISDLYRSFLDSADRTKAGLPMAERLPPLAMFQHDGSDGPVTIEVDLVARFIGGSTGVVCLPATFAAHPILWAALAHETGGHDVTHADPGLLDELTAGLPRALAEAAAPFTRADLVALWGYWMDEAAADVYGLLNMGPAFAENLVAFLAAMNDGPPALRTDCGFEADDPDTMLDPHPTDVLRVALLLGAVKTLSGLAAGARTDAVTRISAMATALTQGGEATLDGNIAMPDGMLVRLRGSADLGAMRRAAEAVGGYIATAQLAALGGKSVQEIETWDDADEATAQAIRAALIRDASVIGQGDDAHLLAGANLAVLDMPEAYDAITARLNAALDHSVRTDPYWSPPSLDRLYLRYAKTSAGKG